MAKEVELNPTIDFVAGTISGIAGLLVGFPFDTVKVRFQSPSLAGRYHSTLHAILTIIREERFIGLYKGVSSPLATAAFMNGLIFASYRFFMKFQLENAESTPTLTQIALAGAGSGIVCSILTIPVELIKIKQQSLLTTTTARQVAAQVLRESGVRGLYRGTTATVLREIGYGPYFASYEATCRYFTSSTTSQQAAGGANKSSWAVLLLAGGIAGIIGWLITFPIDVVKTRIQGSSEISSTLAVPLDIDSASVSLLGNGTAVIEEPNPYRSTWSTIVYSYQTEGVQVFFRGLAPTLIRAIPANMATFVTFEAVVFVLS